MKVFTFTASVAIASLALAGCRNDDGGEELLAWSCANTKATPHPVATAWCLEKIKSEQPEILKFYKPVPIMIDGKLDVYAMIEIDRVKTEIKK